MSLLLPLLGTLVGFSLGLTGGGGAIFAVPLLVYGAGLPAREAVGISLSTVGITAGVGLVQRARRGLVEFPTGGLFALAGMFGAPLGNWLATQISETLLLSSFGLVMLLIAWRMWRKGPAPETVPLPTEIDEPGSTCRRDSAGQLRWTSRCAMLLTVIGGLTGVMTGLFGVGGGFIIVPALVMFTGMGMQRAVGTSLLVITLVSLSGTVSYFVAGKPLSFELVLLFAAGSIAGLFAGSWLARRLAGASLQRIFAGAIVFVAIFVLVKNLGA